ncbi:hypothetical protein Pmar_PMAR001245 [Perkinsus marinus ATCC 50983]|uniref:Uncharacterized protein n=1 Tax=Perkinsus marinus (strain ATCC 50983 / TXsc) TaxID=423536 RepID=C5KT97_PERM5|nr:hypothetical protein Pmar_PMAR001245 [Perkinsus marinus ATCC 50983]EER12447.1 hypothetical protein Pmar_PMAR001245 [Perkinsus marinus ATCC 50983]|eukprot:XP_002780652.1 hypothetical protein Pmar_PMAR001245 [Perkinsus marinus ATCC 50983]
MRFLTSLVILAWATAASREEVTHKENVSMREAAKYVKSPRAHKLANSTDQDFHRVFGSVQSAWQRHSGTGMRTISLSSLAENSDKVQEWLSLREGSAADRGSQEL